MTPLSNSPTQYTSYLIESSSINQLKQQAANTDDEALKIGTKRICQEETQAQCSTKKKSKTDTIRPLVSTKMYHIPWMPQTPEARTIFLLLHHKKHVSEKERASLFSDTFTELDRSRLFENSAPPKDYRSKRILYIFKQAETQTDPLQKWKDLFTSQVSNLKSIPEPQNKKEKQSIRRIRHECKTLLSSLQDTELERLFYELKNGSICFNDYVTLRKAVFNIKCKKVAPAQCIFFPGIRSINASIQSSLKKFTDPIFILASNIFLSIKTNRIHKALTTKQQYIIKKLQDGDFESIMDLEEATSHVSQSIHTTALKKLINNAVAIMERNNIIPVTGPINDVTKHHTTRISNTIQKTKKQPNPNKSIIELQGQSTSTHKAIHIPKTKKKQPRQRPQKTLKVIHINWLPKTSLQKKYLLESYRQNIPEVINMYTHDTNTAGDKYRIIHLHTKGIKTERILSPEQVWKEIFTSHDDNSDIDPKPIVIKQYNLYRTQLVTHLPAEFLVLFNKIERFSITHLEYSQLIKHIQEQKTKLYTYCYVNMFFPSISELNAYTETQSGPYVPKAFILAATAYFTILSRKKGTVKVFTDNEKIILKKMQEGNIGSLKELEYSASVLFNVMSRTTFVKVLNNATAIMENKGVLPITGNFNDPSSQYPSSDEEQGDSDIPSTSKNLQTNKQLSSLPISNRHTQIELLTEHEQKHQKLMTIESLSHSAQQTSTLHTDITTPQTIITEDLCMEQAQQSQYPLLLLNETDIGSTCTIETTVNSEIDLTQELGDTEFEDDSPSTSQTYTNKEETQQKTNNKSTSQLTWTDCIPKTITRSMTAKSVAITQESESIQKTPLSINPRLSSARTRPIPQRTHLSSRITLAISTSLIKRSTLKQAKDLQQIDTTSNKQNDFMSAIGLRPASQ